MAFTGFWSVDLAFAAAFRRGASAADYTGLFLDLPYLPFPRQLVSARTRHICECIASRPVLQRSTGLAGARHMRTRFEEEKRRLKGRTPSRASVWETARRHSVTDTRSFANSPV